MEDTFVYLAQWRVLLCLPCGYCLKPAESTWERHLRSDAHRISGHSLKGLIQQFRSYQLVSPSCVETPRVKIPRIDGLRLYKGFECLSCPQVSTTSLDTIRNHASREHGYEKRRSQCHYWEQCLLQTFFAENRNLDYFFVENFDQQTPANNIALSDCSSVMERVVHQLEERSIENEASQTTLDVPGHWVQVSPWLETTNWTKYLKGRDLAATAMLIKPATPLDDECLLQIVAAFDRLIDQARDSVLYDRINIFDQHKINSFIRNRTASRPILTKLRDGTYRKYKGVWARLLCFVYRMICKSQPPLLHCVVTNSQSRTLDQMINAAKTCSALNPNPDSVHMSDAWAEPGRRKTERDHLDNCCLEFCISLLDHCLKGDVYDSVVIGFLAVLGIDAKKMKFHDAAQYTSHLSAFIKIAQLLLIRRAVVAAEKNEVEHPSDLLDEMQDRFMVFGSRSPINWAQKLRVFGAKLRDSTTSLGHIIWSNEGHRLSYKDLEFDMDGLRKLVRLETEAAQGHLSELLMIQPDESREDVVPILRLFELKDDPTIDREGYSFLVNPRNVQLRGHERWLLARALYSKGDTFLKRQRYESPRSIDKDAPQWRVGAAEKYLEDVDSFLERLLLLAHITGGQPARGTELLSLQWCNTVHGLRRNIFIEDGLISFVTFYHKGYSVTNSTKIIHRYLPKEISEMMVYFLWLVHPFCGQLRVLALGATVQPSPFLWSDSKQRPWESGKLSIALSNSFKRHLDTRANIQLWRHAAISISRRYSKGRHFKRDYDMQEVQHRADLQAGHNSTHAGLIYARGIDEAPGHVESARSEYRALSCDWHSFLGFSSRMQSKSKPLGEVSMSRRNTASLSTGEADYAKRKGMKRVASSICTSTPPYKKIRIAK